MPSNQEAVVSGLTDLYQILVKMQYLPEDLVHAPPHKLSDEVTSSDEPSVSVDACKDVGFDQEVVQLMQQMPYIMGDSDDWYVGKSL